MILYTLANPLRAVRSSGATDASFALRAQTATEPAEGNGVIDIANGGETVPSWGFFVFYATTTSNDVFDARILGWRLCGLGSNQSWLPIPLCELTCTAGAAAGAGPFSGYLVCDTLALATPYQSKPTVIDVISPADDTCAHLILDLKGCSKIEVQFKKSTATTMNAAFAEF